MYGVYFIGLRHFDKLETLVSYYMYYSELVKDEKLLCPIEPERISRIESVYVSVRVLNKEDQIRLRASTRTSSQVNGEDNNSSNSSNPILEIESVGLFFKVYHEVDDEGEWLWAQSVKCHNRYGLLNSGYVKRVVSWFHSYVMETKSSNKRKH
jgi:hypothetical protein